MKVSLCNGFQSFAIGEHHNYSFTQEVAMKQMLSFALILLLLFALAPMGACAEDAVTSESLYVKPVSLPEDFILGVDASSVIAEEQSGVK